MIKVPDFMRRLIGTIPAETEETFKKIDLSFKKNDSITIGAEVELHTLDKVTLAPVDRADDLIAQLSIHSKQYVPEFFKSFIEINSTPHASIYTLEEELTKLIRGAEVEADNLGLALMGSGCHPSMHYMEVTARDYSRYGELLDRHKWLIRRWAVSGMHIHLGMKSAVDCLRFMHFFEHFIPHLVALSASSPFWQSSDTGMHSYRSTISESLSTSSLMYTVNSWGEMTELVERLERSHTIGSLKDLHWDIRPSPGYGTLEIRVFDMPTNLQDMAAICAFVHTMALWFSKHGDWLSSMPKPPMWMARENKWRATRDGLDARIIKDYEGNTVCIREDILNLLKRIDQTVRAKDYSGYIDHLKSIVENGSSSTRQRQVFANSGSLKDVVAHNIQELRVGRPIQPQIPAEEAA